MMNAGARLDEIVHTVRGPEHLLERPYLGPSTTSRSSSSATWRLYGGWWDGDPSHCRRPRGLAAELASSPAAPGRLADWALRCSRWRRPARRTPAGSPSRAALGDAGAPVRAWFATRAEHEASTMSQGVFRWAARESQERGGGPDAAAGFTGPSPARHAGATRRVAGPAGQVPDRVSRRRGPSQPHQAPAEQHEDDTHHRDEGRDAERDDRGEQARLEERGRHHGLPVGVILGSSA